MDAELKQDALAEVQKFLNSLDDLRSYAEHLRISVESGDAGRAVSSLRGINDQRDGYWGAIIVRFSTEATDQLLNEMEMAQQQAA